MALSRDEDPVMQRNRTVRLHLRQIARWALAGAMSLLSITAMSATPAFVITSPVDGAIVLAAKSITITVTISSGDYPYGMAIIGHDPLGTTGLQSVSGTTVTFSLTIPANTPPGSYAVTAVALSSAKALVSSVPVNVIVERADSPTALSVYPPAADLGAIGSTLPLTILGTFPGGLKVDVTQSNLLTASSENTRVAVVQHSTVTAVGAGQTNIDVQYGSITAKLPITVPVTIPGDLNGDGVVNCADFAIIQASLNTAFGQSGFDNRADLNHDGIVNRVDLNSFELLLPTGTVCR
jgi:Dockerin type I domain